MLTCPAPSTFDSKRRANYPDPDSSKRLKTPAPTPINEPEQACSKAHLIFKRMCAYIALDYYNNKNDTRFELVEDETLDSYTFADYSGSWIHCCFNANEGSSVNKFFAELQYLFPLGPAVTTCKILIEGETRVGCQKCSSIIHPVAGYRGGILYKEIAREDIYTRPASPTYTPGPTLDIVAFSEKRRIRSKRIANRALDHYNKTNGTKFAIVNDGSISWAPFSGTWIHICFTANDASAAKLFFAEIKYDKCSEPAVTICKIVEGETRGGCEHCHPQRSVTHPIDGYRGKDPLVVTKIDQKDKDFCHKVYCEEFLGKTYGGGEVI